jgi:transposase InsO family protein
MTELCEHFGVSRKTGYKLLQRYESHGIDGLRDRSRAPTTHPNQLSPQLEAAILRARKAHPTWGSKKLMVVLTAQWPPDELPARSTVDAVLKRAGVVAPRRARRRRQPSAAPQVQALEPNDVWSIDYKGWFKVGDGTRCDPLTVNDGFSRMSLECRTLVAPKLEDVRHRLEALFWKLGLPKFMLSDNGPPFASQGLGKLSRLSVWLLRLGVQPVFIEPGRPDQNGRHERFHETLKAETATPPRASIRAQQAAFDGFRSQYNTERPHEALGMRTPAQLYAPSPRVMPTWLPEHEYASGLEARRVRRDGSIKWTGGFVFVGEAMAHEIIGLEQIDDGRWHVYLGPMRLGVLHERSRTVTPIGEDEDQPSVTHVPGHASSHQRRRDSEAG